MTNLEYKCVEKSGLSRIRILGACLFFFQPLFDQYFDRIQHILENTELQSRNRFMLQDILELRKNKVTCYRSRLPSLLSAFFWVFILQFYVTDVN